MRLLTAYKKGKKKGRKKAENKVFGYMNGRYFPYIGSYADLERAVFRIGEITGYNEYGEQRLSAAAR